MLVMSLEQEIKNRALELGFDAVGITDAAPVDREHVEHFEAWLRSGYAGRMQYMQRNFEQRLAPAQLLDGAKSVVVVALAYKPWPEDAKLPVSTQPMGKVAQYAQYEDYHFFMKSLLHELADFLGRAAAQEHQYRVCVDSAPVAEKALAVRAGLGFIGRHHLLIHPRFGPQVLLGEIVTTVSLEPDEPCGGACRNCDACVKACPTGALQADGFLDARKCISCGTQYGCDDETVPSTCGWLFGCDECLLACPFARSAPPRVNQCFRHYPDRARLGLRELLDLTPAAFAARFCDSPIRKIGWETLQRNAQACLDNLGRG